VTSVYKSSVIQTPSIGQHVGLDLVGISSVASGRQDVKYTFKIVSPNGSELEVGVKSEEELKQWVDAIRNCTVKTLVCMSNLCVCVVNPLMTTIAIWVQL